MNGGRLMMSDLEQLRQWQQQGALDSVNKWLLRHPEAIHTDDASLHAILSLCLLLQDRHKEAQLFFNQIQESSLIDAASLADFALCCFVQGQERALSLIERATQLAEADSIAWARQGAFLMSQNKLDEAEASFSRSLLMKPNCAEVLSNLAGIRVREGNLKEALSLYDRALGQGKYLQVAEQQRSQVLIQLGEIDQLLDEKLEQLLCDRDNELLHRQLATIQLQANRKEDALATLSAAVEQFEESLPLKIQFIQVLNEQKQSHKAGACLKAWLEDEAWLSTHEEEPKRLALKQLRLVLNQTRIKAGFLQAAQEGLELDAEEFADDPMYSLICAELYVEQNRAEEAVELLAQTIENYPGLIQAYHQIASALTSLGRLEEAAKYSESITSISPSAVVQHVENHGYQADDNELKALRELLHSPLLVAQSRASAGFTLHKALEKRKDYDAAFEVLMEANGLVKETIDFHWKQHRKATQDVIQVFDKNLVDSLKDKGLLSERPIFVVGMPRSGTTLTEQIISSHSQVFGAGELGWMTKITGLMKKVVDVEGQPYPFAMADINEFQLKSAGQYYLDKIALLNNDAKHVVDKMPHNFDNVGLIALAFPNAKIIQLERDPLDNGISNYQQNFANKMGLMGFAFDLEWIGEMINDHDELMRHWKSLFPGRIYTLNYQELVNDPDTIIRELIDFCGLPWESSCLSFYDNKSQVRTASIRQVRQKMYTSSAEKWRRYEQYLGPLQKALQRGYVQLNPEELGDHSRGVTPLGLEARTQ
jgi:tetratricopeptide (TPR) repeat protein